MPVRSGSPRGLFAAYRLQVVQEGSGVVTNIDTNSTALTIDRGIQLNGKTTARITGDSTGVVLAGKVKVQNAAGGLLGANSTSLLLPGGVRIGATLSLLANSTGFYQAAMPAAKPSTESVAKLTLVTNSTGVSGLAINTTGTTWKYFNVTSVIPS